MQQEGESDNDGSPMRDMGTAIYPLCCNNVEFVYLLPNLLFVFTPLSVPLPPVTP
jgi:hypothetical protein